MLNLEKLKTYSIYITLVIMNLGVVLKAYGLDSFRYLIYFPAVLGLFFLILNKFRLEGLSVKNNTVNAAFFLLVINGILHLPLLNEVGYSQLFFILSALLPVIVFKSFSLNWRYISIIFVSGYILAIGGNEISIEFSLQRFFTSDISSAETNQHPFVFGILTLFFLYKKDKKFFLLNLFFVLLSFKRIVFVGVLAAIPFVLIERHNRIILKNKRWLFLIANVIVLFIIISFTQGLYDDLIREITGLSSGHFTSGRQLIYSEIINEFNNSSVLNKLFGNGQGFTFLLTTNLIKHAPHNDLLVLLIDHGIIVFVIFIALLYKTKILNPVLFTNIIFITDNTLVYTFYLMILFLVVNYFTNNKQTIK